MYVVYILYCTSNLWEFKGHVKFAEINAVVSSLELRECREWKGKGAELP